MTGGAVVRTVLDTGAGREGLVRRLVELDAGSRFEGAAGPGGELWFVIAGTGALEPGAGPPMPVRRDTGVWLPPGARYRLSAGGPLPPVGRRPAQARHGLAARRSRGPGRGCHAAAAVRAA